MSVLFYLLVGLYVIVAVILIAVVLLQTGKGADLAGAFGGGGSQTAFGARGTATFLSKMTTFSAILFMVLALTLSIIYNRQRGGSLMGDVPVQPATTAPATTPAQSPPAQQQRPPSPQPQGQPQNQPAKPPPSPPGGAPPSA